MAKLPEERYGSCSEFLGALSIAIADCPDWRPLAPRIPEETEKAVGNGWYAPETVISSRLLEAESAQEPQVLTPVVLPPEPETHTAISTRVATEAQREQYASVKGLGLRPQSSAPRVRVERPAARTWGITMAACALIAILGIGLLRILSMPKTDTSNSDTSRVITTTPEDLSSTNKPSASSEPQTDLTVNNPVATPASAQIPMSSRTTVAVQAHRRTRREQAALTPSPRSSRLCRFKRYAACRPFPCKAEREPVRVIPPPITPVIASDVELVSDPPGAQVEVDNRSDASCLAPCSVLAFGPRPPYFIGRIARLWNRAQDL